MPSRLASGQQFGSATLWALPSSTRQPSAIAPDPGSKPDSSDPGLASDPVPIDTDHIEIAKPANRQSLVYQLVCNFIVRQTGRPVSHEERKIDVVKDDTQAIRENLERVTAEAKFRQDVLRPIPVTHRLKIEKFIEYYLGTQDQPVPFGGRQMSWKN